MKENNMTTLRSADIDIHLGQMYDLQKDGVHIHFVKLGHRCESESDWELLRTANIHPTIRVYFYHPRLTALIKSLQKHLKQDIDYPTLEMSHLGLIPLDVKLFVFLMM